jgi:hypothetical protein
MTEKRAASKSPRRFSSSVVFPPHPQPESVTMWKAILLMIRNILLSLMIPAFVACFMNSTYAEHVFSVGNNEPANKEEIELVVRKLIRDIYKREYDAIIALIPQEGVMDYDELVSKEEIKNDLLNENSWFHKALYKDVTDKQIEFCLGIKTKELYVSPYAFYKAYGEDYQVGIDKSGIFRNSFFYLISVTGKELSKERPCKYKLWFLRLKDGTDGKYLLDSLLFR